MKQEAAEDVPLQGLTPCLQDAEEAYLGSEMPRVPAAISLE
jgi:hypothetical protein